ncbi:MAG: type IX secretion system protein PorQ [Muribaculaceae bacterium]|nr:type IX secretion system protein PorQ [Muribaculaceae bacterium]
MISIKKYPAALLLLMFSLIYRVAPAMAQGGNTAYDFLDIPSSSYVFGMGGANISTLHSDLDLAAQNPALIGPENDRELKLGYMHYYSGGNFASVRYGMAAGERGAWAAGIRYLNYGNFKGYEADGSYTGDFTAQDVIFEGTYSHDFTYRLRGGINVKMVYSAYEQYSAFAMAADLGLNYYDDYHELSLGLVLKNMGGQLKRFEDRYDRVPFDVQLGLTKGFKEAFSFSITAWHLTKWKLPYYVHEEGGLIEQTDSGFFRNFFRHLVFGLDYSPSDRFYINLGYNYKSASDMAAYQRNFFSGFSIGAGFKVRAYSAGVAFAMPHKGGATLLLNLGLDITELLN